MRACTEVIKFMFISALLAAAAHASAQQDLVAMAVQEIARQHNANSQSMIDQEVLATLATANGKNVIFTNTMNVGVGLTAEQIERFRVGAFQYVAPRTCQIVLRNDIFERGLYYTFVYRYRSGERLTAFNIDLQRCKALATSK